MSTVKTLPLATRVAHEIAERLRSDGEIDERAMADWIEQEAILPLLESLEAVLQLMTDGILVRDTRNDHDPAWAIKQMPLVMALKKADEAIRLSREDNQP